MRSAKKIISKLLVFGLVVGLVNVPAPERLIAAETEKSVVLGAGAIKPTDTKWASADVEDSVLQGNKVYYGQYNSSPVAYRVLKAEDGKILLDCDTTLFNSKILNSDAAPNTAKWAGSSLQSKLNGTDFLASTSVFNEIERSNIVQTELEAVSEGTLHNTSSQAYTCQSSDKIFLLSYSEVDNLYYGNSSQQKTGTSSTWWTRSYLGSGGFAVAVGNGDFVAKQDMSGATIGVSPAFNINESAIAFTSNVSVNRPSSLTATTAKTSNDWLLALYDGSGFNASLTGESSVEAGQSISVNVSSNATGSNNYTQISALLVDNSGNVAAYGKVCDVTTGTVSVTIPSGISGGQYTLKLFDEAVINASSNLTSYVSNMADLSITVTQAAAPANPITGISLSAQSLDVTKGNTGKLTATVTPADTSDSYSVVWASDNTAAVTVDQSGNWSAVGNGTAKITASVNSSVNGTKTATCTINVTNNLTSISLSTSSATLNVNDTLTLSVTYVPDDTTQSKSVTFTSTDSSIAAVDSSGKITAKSPGTTTITATSTANNSIKATCVVTVKAPITGLSLSQSTASVEKGNTLQLSVSSVTPGNTTDVKTVKWSSDNTSVATVDSATGLVTAKAPGSATITATSDANSSVKASCNVTVTSKVTGVNISTSSVTLNKGETHQLSANVTPDDTTESKTIAWSTSDASIATVSSDGLVTAVGSGQATITAKSSANGTVSAQCVLTVNVPLTGITLNMQTLSLTKGADGALSVKSYTPADTTDSISMIWSSNNTNAVTVDSNGKVTAVGIGTATITATSSVRSNVKATCTITVTESAPADVHLVGISVTPDNLTFEKGEKQSLIVSYSPSNTTDSKDVTWKSDKESVATVSSTGEVTAIAPGDAVITATSKADGEITAICKVKVTSKLTGITLSNSTINMSLGDVKSLTVGFNPSDTTDSKSVVWSSDNESVVKVDEHGVITAVGGGKTAVTATSAVNSSIKASCTVNVSNNITGVNISSQELTLEREMEHHLPQMSCLKIRLRIKALHGVHQILILQKYGEDG